MFAIYLQMSRNITFITYGTNGYEGAKNRIKKEALEFGMFKSINAYSACDIDQQFLHKYSEILGQPRGNGYWLWKLYFVQKILREIEYGDYIVYCDAGCTINKAGINRFKEYLKILDDDPTNRGIISFQMCFPEEQYTTSQIFSALNVTSQEVKHSGQYIATILIIKKSPNVISILEDFFRVVDSDHKLITDYYNSVNQSKSFVDNRHDQSILSVIRKIRGSIVLGDETYWHDFNCAGAKLIPFLATRKKYTLC